ncbi:restriction endonuclease subunit S [Defluviimonas salinarum]|uniref:Restriction endonuclease subunit S n=1 Tax=Defluviimonas salinarum TaxID=2992147 RepID=A0ABT3J6A2_9RHOB|nr:restriction endonuclease subunit S [Defluviimonas salinarum]MCW3783217.1 restriction endonuclease subunit S [Defluviimonas salinarum]
MTEGSAPLPEGWSFIPLGDLMKFQNGFNTDKSAYGHGLRFANVLEVITNTHLKANLIPGRVATSASETNRYLVQRGDILFNRTSETQEEVGLGSVYLDDEPILFGGFVLRGKPISDALDPLFAGYGLRSQIVRQQIMAAGQGGIRANIGQQSLSKIKIALPGKSEQEAIAEALSDADALIEGIERLIAKKRLIKQGAMQELLTAKRRLPGFSGEWVERPLSSISAFITKGATPTTYGFGWETHGILFLRSECVSPRGLDLSQSMFISEEAHRATRRSEVSGGDILITITGNVGRVVRLPHAFEQANINQHIARIRITAEDVNPDFVFHQLSRPEYLGYFNSIVTGQAYPQISLQQVREAKVALPCSEEQMGIALLLNDMDAEIQTLETRLEKARAIKEGMMQNLLTGRIRLV